MVDLSSYLQAPWRVLDAPNARKGWGLVLSRTLTSLTCCWRHPRTLEETEPLLLVGTLEEVDALEAGVRHLLLEDSIIPRGWVGEHWLLSQGATRGGQGWQLQGWVFQRRPAGWTAYHTTYQPIHGRDPQTLLAEIARRGYEPPMEKSCNYLGN